MSILESLHSYIEKGIVPTVAMLGGTEAIARDTDALAASPFLDILVRAIEDADTEKAAILDPIILRCFIETNYPLVFRDAIDIVINSPILLKRLGSRLQTVLQTLIEQRGHAKEALIAAYSLEALFRLALAGIVTHHRPLALMVEIRTDEDELFAAHAARLAGAAYHIWKDESLVQALQQLSQLPDSVDDATFELGLIWLSKALDSTDKTSIFSHLETAHTYFDQSFHTGDQRNDALAYRATIDLIRTFSNDPNSNKLDNFLSQIETAVCLRATWLDVINLPDWFRPRLDRDVQWLKLVRLVKEASTNLSRSSWLNAASVMEQVLAVYDADRTIRAGVGLKALLRPTIEAAFIKERGLLNHLDELLSLSEWPSLGRETVNELRARINALEQEGKLLGKIHGGAHFPLLTGILQDSNLINGIKPEAAAQLEAALSDHLLRFEAIGNTIIQGIMARLSAELESCDHYRGAVRNEFDTLTLHVLAFCRDRLDTSRRERGARGEYLTKDNAVEDELQSDLREYLVGNHIQADIRTEVDGVGAGRTDIYVSSGAQRYIIELKREFTDTSPAALRQYLGQAGAYQGTNVRLGLLGVLDLTQRVGPPPHLEENFWVDKFVPQDGHLARHVVVFRVPGRLLSPSQTMTPNS